MAAESILSHISWPVGAWCHEAPDAQAVSNGQEWNASLSWALDTHWTVLGKLADYQADEYLADTSKLRLSVEYVY